MVPGKYRQVHLEEHAGIKGLSGNNPIPAIGVTGSITRPGKGFSSSLSAAAGAEVTLQERAAFWHLLT